MRVLEAQQSVERFSSSDISNVHFIANPELETFNTGTYHYSIHIPFNSKYAVFYLHGLEGSRDSCAEIDGVFLGRKVGVIRPDSFPVEFGYNRTENFSISENVTFGDFCQHIHNNSSYISWLADKHGLERYGIIAHSWGGFIAAVNATHDQRCDKVMLLASTPDICDTIANSHTADDGKREEAYKAKFGKSLFQANWDQISPYNFVRSEPKLHMLIFNNADDHFMKKDNVLQFQKMCIRNKLARVETQFVYNDATDKHDMPPSLFLPALTNFFFEGEKDNHEKKDFGKVRFNSM